MFKTIISRSLIFWVLLPLFAQEPTKTNIAVNELSGNGIDQATAEICSDRLRNELVRTGVFRVMERSEMKNILKEQGFQQSGVCDDKECMIEVGRLLGVEAMVAGSIGKVGNFHTISLRIIDIKTAEILKVVDEDFTGSVQDLISQAIGKTAIKLARQSIVKSGESKEDFLTADDSTHMDIVVEKTKGSLVLKSKPKGADVYLNGKKAGVTNWQNNQQEPGAYALKITMDNYESIEDSLFVLAGKTFSREYNLKRKAASNNTAVIQKGKTSRKFQLIRRISFGILSITSAGIGYVFERNSNTEYSEYLDTKAYNQQLHEENWNQVESAEKIRNALYVAGMVSAIGFIVSIPF